MVYQTVQEMTVMRHYYQRAFVLLQILFQYFQGHDVKVVGRLVQDEEVGLLHQDGKQVQAPAFTTGKAFHRIVEHVVGKQESAQKMSVVHCLEHSLARLELHSGLMIIADSQRLSKIYHSFHCAAHFRLPATGNQVQECGLSGSIPPHYSHTFIALEVVGEVFQIALAIPPETYIPAVNDFIAKIGVFYLSIRQINLFGYIAALSPILNIPEGLFTVFCLAGAGAWTCVHPFQFSPEEVAHLLCFCVVIVYAFLAFFQEVHIVSAVNVYAAAVHFHYCVAHPVQEIAVMRNHEKCASGVLQMAFQELNGVYIQVVGGLVHYVEIGLTGKHARQSHTLDFSAGEVLHGLVLICKAKLVQQPGYPELILPQVVCVKMLSPFGRIVHYLTENGLLGVICVLLLQKSNAYVFEKQHLATAVRRILSCKYPQQRGLSSAIRGDERHLVSLIDIEINPLKQNLGTVTFGNVLYLKITWHNGYKDNQLA